MSRINLSDGSTYPRPDLGNDDEVSMEWKLRYAPRTLTRGEQLQIAGIISAYNYLVLETTQMKRDLVCGEIRQALNVEADQ